MAESGRREVEQWQRSQREERETPASADEDQGDRDHLDRARDREWDQQNGLVDLLDVGVGVRHELTGLGAVVEREVEGLEMRDQAHPEIALDSHREPERGVPTDTGAHRLDGAHEQDRDHPVRAPPSSPCWPPRD